MKTITKPRWGLKPPLFDRIKEPAEGQSPHRLLDEKGLMASLQRELGIMMGSRVSLRKVQYDDHIETIPVYGAPDYLGLVDFSYFDAQNNNQWKKIEAYLKTAIETVEPRLRNVQATVVRYNPEYQEVYIEVGGRTRLGKASQNVVFPVALNTSRQK